MIVGIYTVSLFRQITGIERVGLRLANALIDAGHEVVWITPSGPVAPIEALPAGLTVEHFPIGFSRETVLTLREILVRRQPDVVVAMVTNGIVSIFPPALAGLNIPFIFSEHSDPDFYVQKWWGFGGTLSVRSEMRRAVISCADAVHLVSDIYLETIHQEDRERTVEIPNAATDSGLVANVSGKGLPKKRFISVGRLASEKALSQAIEAFALVAKIITDWDYYIFGEGQEHRRLEMQIESLGLQGRVFLAGYTESPIEEMARSQVLLLPSTTEGWSVVGAEAQSIGLPILGFADCRAIAKMISGQRGGILLQERSVLSLSGVMLDIVESPKRRSQLSKQGIRAAQEYSGKYVDSMWLDLIEKTAAISEVNLKFVSSSYAPMLDVNLVHKHRRSGTPRKNVDFLEAQINLHEEYRRSQDRKQSLGNDIVDMLGHLRAKQVRRAARLAKKKVWPQIRSRGKEGLRRLSRRLPHSKITLFTLNGIEDGPKHLLPHLRERPRIVRCDAGEPLGVANYMKLVSSSTVVAEGGVPQRYQSAQEIIQIWHSTGFIKKAANLSLEVGEAEFQERIGRFDYVISPSLEMVGLYAKAFCVGEGQVLPLGSMKTDYLLQPSVKNDYRTKLFEKLPDLRDKKLYVYCPTFRGTWPSCVYHFSSILLDEIQEELEDDERLLINLHPRIAMRPSSERNRLTNLVPEERHTKILMPDGVPAEWLLSSAECFISDYSGGLLDAIAGNIPTVCFADDLASYIQNLTGGFLDEVPNLVTSKGSAAFIAGIRKARSDTKQFRYFRRKWVGACDGSAGKRVAEFVEGR